MRAVEVGDGVWVNPDRVGVLSIQVYIPMAVSSPRSGEAWVVAWIEGLWQTVATVNADNDPQARVMAGFETARIAHLLWGGDRPCPRCGLR